MKLCHEVGWGCAFVRMDNTRVANLINSSRREKALYRLLKSAQFKLLASKNCDTSALCPLASIDLSTIAPGDPPHDHELHGPKSVWKKIELEANANLAREFNAKQRRIFFSLNSSWLKLRCVGTRKAIIAIRYCSKEMAHLSCPQGDTRIAFSDHLIGSPCDASMAGLEQIDHMVLDGKLSLRTTLPRDAH